MNKGVRAAGRRLSEGDEVSSSTPVSGGEFRLTADPIDLGAVIAEVADGQGRGGHVPGATRVRSRGRTVMYLEYEAYEGMAEKVMEEIASTLRERYELCRIAITHRIGRVGIGETSVAIAVSAPSSGARPGRLQGGDRHTQGRRPLEEGGLRGRRGVDRAVVARRRGPEALVVCPVRGLF